MQVVAGGAISRPIGLDFPAVFAMASAIGADRELLAGVLPGVERAILLGLSGDGALEDDFD